jgi:hypothetical protein
VCRIIIGDRLISVEKKRGGGVTSDPESTRRGVTRPTRQHIGQSVTLGQQIGIELQFSIWKCV